MIIDNFIAIIVVEVIVVIGRVVVDIVIGNVLNSFTTSNTQGVLALLTLC